MQAAIAKTKPYSYGIIVLKTSAKKFQLLGYPTTFFIATKFPESTESLRNFKAIPGTKGELRSVAEG